MSGIARMTLSSDLPKASEGRFGAVTLRGEERHRQGHCTADRGRNDGHLECLEHWLERAWQKLPVRLKQLAEDARAAGDVLDEAADVEADAELRAQRRPRDDEERHQAGRDDERAARLRRTPAGWSRGFGHTAAAVVASPMTSSAVSERP